MLRRDNHHFRFARVQEHSLFAAKLLDDVNHILQLLCRVRHEGDVICIEEGVEETIANLHPSHAKFFYKTSEQDWRQRSALAHALVGSHRA